MTFFSFLRAGLLLPLAALLALPARAQRLRDPAPPRDPFGHPPAPEVPGGRYLSHSYQNGVLTIRATDGSTRQVQPWAEGVVKISYFAPGRPPVADSSVSVVQPAADLSTATFARKFDASPSVLAPLGKPFVLLFTGALLDGKTPTVVVDKQTLRISLEDGQGTLFTEAAPAYRRQPALPPDPDTPPIRIDELAGTGVRFALQPGERLYGTGSRALPLDRRGYRLELYNQAHYGYGNGEPALNVTLPVVLSSRGYLVLFDHYAAGYLDMGKKNPSALEYGAEGLNSLSYYVITGQSQAEILSRYTALTGRQPLPPRWALGLIQSRFGYRSQAEMLNVARQMRANDFPLDALVLDLYWFGGTTRQGDFQWDAKNFPNPAGMMRDLKAQGVNTILISEPYVMRTSLNDSLVRTQQLVGTTATGRPFTVGSFWAGPASILDVYKPATRAWLWAQYQRLHDQGAAGWWSDLGEPENHPEAMRHMLGTTRQVHNAYGITWAKIFQDHYAQEYPQERLFNLARSGWAGMQRNSVFPWSGDISRTWSGLQAQVPIMLSMGQVGVGYMHSDAGGFGANATRDPELYTRWLQMAALGPIMRPHSDQVVPPEPYTYPEPYRSIVRKYAHLRAELLPYLYTLAAENTLSGAPLVRAMDFTGHPSVGRWDDTSSERSVYFDRETMSTVPAASLLNSQYLLGSSLLVAPVSEPGQRRRNVYLPATPGGWVDFETGQALAGGQTVGLSAPLAHVPLLVRAGSFVPVTTYRASSARFRPDTVTINYFPRLIPEENQSYFALYEDDGQSAQALAKNQYTATQFFGVCAAATPQGRQVAISILKAGSYPGEPAEQLVKLCIAQVAVAPTTIQLNGQLLAAANWQFDNIRHELHLRFPLRTKAEITIPNLRQLTTPASNLDPETVTLTAPDNRTFERAAGLHYVRYAPAAAPAPVRIRNAQGQMVRELPTEAAAGTYALRWDGRDQQGRLVPLGYYDAELAGQHQRLVKLPPSLD